MEVGMSEKGTGVIAVIVFLLGMFHSSAGLADIELVPPEVVVTEGDREVDVVWSDPDPELLVSIDDNPALGTIQFPWQGNAGLRADGFYTGACDWIYDVAVGEFAGNMEFSWFEVTDWVRKSLASRRIAVTELDRPYELSDGIRVTVESEGLYELLPGGVPWTGPTPAFSGIYRGGAGSVASQPVVFVVTCVSGGELGAGGGDPIEFEWTNDIQESGSFEVDRPDSAFGVSSGLRVRFGTGTFSGGEQFGVSARIALVEGDRFSVTAHTFEGYLVIRHSVEDRPGQYKVRANISKCDNPGFFEDENGEPDPYGARHFRDKGIETVEPGVTPDPNVSTVLNGFPYDYAVVTYDIDAKDAQVLSDAEWQQVFPSGTPRASVNDMYVVPNPYNGRAGWEVGESKIQFVNIPVGALIRIYDATGGYIREVRPNLNLDGSQAGTADWDLRNGEGKDVVSGVYIYRVESNYGSKTGRFIVVR
jgi:hypothetical protein